MTSCYGILNNIKEKAIKREVEIERGRETIGLNHVGLHLLPPAPTRERERQRGLRGGGRGEEGANQRGLDLSFFVYILNPSKSS